MKRWLNGFALALLLSASLPAAAQYAAADCNAVVNSSQTAATNQKNAFDKIGESLQSFINAANACSTTANQAISSAVSPLGSLLGPLLNNAASSLANKACSVITQPVTNLLNTGYTLPGGMGQISPGSVLTNGVENTVNNAINSGVNQAVNTATNQATSNSLWDSISNALSFK